MTPTGFGQEQSGACEPEGTGALTRARAPGTRLALPVMDRLAVASFAAGAEQILLEEARGLAEALASQDADGARQRTISRAIAVCRAQLDLVDAAIGQLMGQANYAALDALGRHADRLARRLHMLLQEHRVELRQAAPVQMVIGHASQVTLRSGG